MLKKRYRKSQVAMEYVMILSLVLLILTPTIYIFREYVMKSGDDITINQMNRIANTILETSMEMFYLGAPSKIVIDLEMPDKIEAMWLMDNSQDTEVEHEYFLMFKLNLQGGEQIFYFDSDVPIKSLEHIVDTTLNDQCGNPVDIKDGNGQVIGQTTFECYRFPPTDYSPGVKHFKIEASACKDIGLCVIIDEVSSI